VRALPIAVGLSLVGGFGGLGIAATLLLFNDPLRLKVVPWLVSYAVGALLGVSLLELLPQALTRLDARAVFVTLLIGILSFFVLEKLALWRHCHTHECDVHRSTAPLVLIGDAAHNFMDGAVIGAAVLTSVPLGISTAIAVLAHEIPHEVGDFAILLHAGFSRSRALLFNAVAEAMGVAGAIVAVLGFSLSMAFRRRWRFKSDVVAFYVIMLALMTPAFLVSLGNQLLWSAMGQLPSLWKTALGANVIWGVPFSFLVMLAVWNRYDRHVEEAARDLGADQKRTFREVTLPLVWTGIFGSFLFGFTLTWNDFDRTVLLVLDNTLPLQIVGLIQAAALRPDLYALGTATTLVSLIIIVLLLIVIGVRTRFAKSGSVTRVEEEFGLGGGIDAEAAEEVVQA